MLVALLAAAASVRAQSPAAPAPVDADRFSRALLGCYRNVLDIDDQILKACATYGVDPNWARAICLYESGGNPDLRSGVGAEGYFQVMPRTYRGLGVTTNIEAGVKYLAQMNQRYGREDYATAAYNGGPLFVDKDRAFKLETLQYVIGVGYLRAVLMEHEPRVRELARGLSVYRVGPGDTWWTVSQKTKIPIVELRMYNPFFAHRETLEAGNRIVHPAAPGPLPFTYANGVLTYRTRLGDNPLWIAFMFGVPSLDDFRAGNRIWRLQSLPEGKELAVDLRRGSDYKDYVVQAGDTLVSLAGGDEANVWDFVRDSGRFDQKLSPGETIRIWLGTTTPTIQPAAEVAAAAPATPAPRPKAVAITYRVKRGDTLFSIAKAYGTTVDDLRRINGLTRRARLAPGQRIRVPGALAVGG